MNNLLNDFPDQRFTLTGRVDKLLATKQVNPNFIRRDLVLGVPSTSQPPYGVTQYHPVLIEFTQEGVGPLDLLVVGQEVVVEFTIRGREYSYYGEPAYYNTLAG